MKIILSAEIGSASGLLSFFFSFKHYSKTINLFRAKIIKFSLIDEKYVS